MSDASCPPPPASVQSEPGNVALSVIVPVRNEERYISRTLQQLLEQDADEMCVEVIVVDGRSTDNTRQIVRSLEERHSHLRMVDNPRRLSSAGRNLGIQDSTGDFILIIDGHCEIPSRTYFRDVLDAFDRTDADCLGRPQPLDVSEATPLQRAIAAARDSWLGHHPDSFIYSTEEVACPAISVAVAYRRSVFGRVGLFDESFDACEDCELNHRCDQLGMSCWLVPNLRVKYEPRRSFAGLFRQLFRYGRGRVRLAAKHSDAFSWPPLALMFAVVGLFLGPLAAFVHPLLWYPYLGVVCLYLCAVLITSALLSWRGREAELMLSLPLVFLAIHAAAGCGSLAETLSGPRFASQATSVEDAHYQQ